MIHDDVIHCKLLYLFLEQIINNFFLLPDKFILV